MKNIKLIIILVVLLLIVHISSAAVDDFSAYAADSELDICTCSTLIDPILIENKGEIKINYEVVNTGYAAKWSTVGPSGFSLGPGESIIIYNHITVSCDAPDGSYDLNTIISSELGLKKVLKQVVNVNKCPNVEITYQENVTGCSCYPIQMDFTLRNTGDFSDIYTLNIEPFDEWVVWTHNLLSLKAGDSKLVTAFMNLPCYLFGDYDADLEVLSENTRLKTIIPLKLNIPSCYDYDVVVEDKEYVFCEEESSTVAVTLSNNVGIDTKFNLNLASESWVSIGNESVKLKEKDDEKINIYLSPPEGAKGEYDLTLDFITDKGDVTTLELPFRVNKCYLLDIAVPEYEETVCSAVTTKYGVLGMNNGTFTEEVNFYLDGPEWSSLSLTQSTSLGAGENVNFDLELNPSEENIGEKAVINLGIESEHSMAGTSLELEVVDKTECYKAEIKVGSIIVGYESKVYTIKVTNNGLKTNDYGVKIVGLGWVSINEVNLNLEPGETGFVNILSEPGEEIEEGDYSLKVDLQSKDVSSSREITLKLRKSPYLWLLWLVIPLIILAVVLAIVVGKKKPKKKKSKKKRKKENNYKLS